MKKNISYSSITILLLAVAVVVMSVGFATFSTELDINGTTTVAGASWNVAFDEDSYTESTGSVNVSADNRTITTTSMTYAVTLSKPGDFYEFTINAVNSGTFNANLTGITMTALTTEQSKYLTYKVYYNGTEYTATNDSLSIALNSGATIPVKVRVEYVQPANASELPSTEQKITLDASFAYVQVAD